MARPFVLGIDCMLYFMPLGSRVTAADDTARPRQMMVGTPPAFDNDPIATTSYCLVKTTQDATLNLTATTADVTSRYGNGWRQVVSALKEGTVDFTVLWEPDDAVFKDMLAAYIEQCPVAFAILDGPFEGFATVTGECQDGTTGTDCDGSGASTYSARCDECGIVTGLHADFVITSFTRNEALEEAVTADITIEPAHGQIYPEWLTIPVRAT